jgi:hypothetical protein
MEPSRRLRRPLRFEGLESRHLLSATIPKLPIPTANSGPSGIAAGPGGNLLLTEGAAHQIGHVQIKATMDGPTVLALQRFGLQTQPTTLVLTFSEPLDPTRAQDLHNYQLFGPHGHQIPITQATYAADAVTLRPSQRLPVHDSFLLAVNGTAPNGLTSATGVLLDGSGTGQPGSNFVTRFGQNALAGSSNVAFNQVRYQWAGPGPFGGLQFAAPSVAAPAGS